MELHRMPSLKIGHLEAALPIVQGGMGVGISLAGLASSVAEEGGVGVIATAGIGRLEPDFRRDLRAANRRALAKEIRRAREATNGIIGVNIMVALSDYADMVAVAVEEGADLVFMGAGLPLKLPSMLTIERMRSCATRFVPKVSSARAARLICRHWDRHFRHLPDALVIEGPKAGGHLGFRREQIDDPDYSLERLLPEMVETVAPFEDRYGRALPVIAAGGIYTGGDIRDCLELGASGVKMGTRFVGTYECDAHDRFKEAYLRCREEDLTIIDSPVGLPGRAIANRFLRDVVEGIKKPYHCAWRCLQTCDVSTAPYCIAQALNQAKEGKLSEGFAFAGANAFRVRELTSVKKLMAILKGEFEAAAHAARQQPCALGSHAG